MYIMNEDEVEVYHLTIYAFGARDVVLRRIDRLSDLNWMDLDAILCLRHPRLCRHAPAVGIFPTWVLIGNRGWRSKRRHQHAGHLISLHATIDERHKVKTGLRLSSRMMLL